MPDWSFLHPRELRAIIRENKLNRPTTGMCKGYAQANLVVLPKEFAFDFLLFAQRNPKPCPVLDVTEPGSPEPRLIAQGADIRRDISKYRVYVRGELMDEPQDVMRYWRDNLVGFLLGCSFSFESGLLEAGIPVRHIDADRNVPMYITSIQCRPAGVFRGPTVVSMRAIPQELVVRAVQITSRMPAVHGAPLHFGDPAAIGIRDINKPEFGDPPVIKPGDVPVFWACGVTPQAVAMQVKPEFMITHAPGHMFVADIKDSELAVI